MPAGPRAAQRVCDQMVGVWWHEGAMKVGRFWPDELSATELAALDPGASNALNRRLGVLVGAHTAVGCERAGRGSVVLAEHDTIGSGATGGAGGPLHGWRAEPDDWPNQLVLALLRPFELKLALLPVIGGLPQRSFAAGHPRSHPSRRRGPTTGT